MPTTLKSKSIEQLLAEADELVQKFNSEYLEDLEENHRLQFERHAQKLQEIKSEVRAKTEEKGTIESFSSAEGMHEAILDIVKAMKDLTRSLI
jgi:predicted transposase YdaD